MKSSEILKTYVEFFKERGHAEVPNVSLIPQGDSTLLYVNSGMFPLVPYLSGQPHPLGTRLVNFQRCLRFFEELDHIGETLRHTTAFHMFGNWSLNDYFKEEQLPWIFELLIEKFKLDPKRLYTTVFRGNDNAPKDTEAVEIVKKLYAKYGIDAQEGVRIFALSEKDNWWKRGDAPGELGGPSAEFYYYIGEEGKDGTGEGLNLEEHDDTFLEIGNSVFMEYKKREDGGWEKIPQHNIDFGGGLERVALLLQGKTDIFETDNFWPIIEKVQEISGKDYNTDFRTKKAMRVLADHMRAATWLAMDGVIPSNKDQGYILRRLIRRMVRFGRQLGIQKDISVSLVGTIAKMLDWVYPDLINQVSEIETVFAEEEEKFQKMLNRVTSKVHALIDKMPQKDEESLALLAFDLYQSEGYPHEFLLVDLEDSHNIKLDFNKFEEKFKEHVSAHQNLSRQGAEKKFKGGLADHSEVTIKYHTATHLLQAALKEVLGDHVSQKGSNITNERLRFDFPHEDRLTDEQMQQVQNWINDKVKAALSVNSVVLPKEEAEKTGALHVFGEKYGDMVTIYYIGDTLESAVSKEFCGGPHVTNTSEIGEIEVYKQEAVGKGIRRIYARIKN